MAQDFHNSKDELYDLVVRVYKNYYDIDEIRELKKFYKTPLGRKTIQVTPSLMQQLHVEFDEHRLRTSRPMNVSNKARDPIEWDPETRRELERTEYPALLRYGCSTMLPKITAI